MNTNIMNTFLLIYVVHVWSIISISASNTEVALVRRDLTNFTELARYDGYETETHTATTTDGYILTIYRVMSGNCSEIVGSEPIIFMHGLFLSGADCIIPGPNGSHCYEYANKCYDVWVPNSRGTFYSRKHETLDPDKDPEYWNFSFDEMAQYDTPAVIDYVLEKTGKKKITFIGFAQGATLLLNLCAAQPEYNDKISVAIGLSMTAWLDNCNFVAIKVAGTLAKIFTFPLASELNKEFVPLNGIYQPTLKLLCGTTDLSYPSCSAGYFALLGNNKFQIPMDTLKVMTGHLPGGTSLKNFLRWGQIRNNGFTHPDYGIIKNLQKYGQLAPPVFDLSNVTMKWIFLASKNDYVSNETDVDTLMTKLPNSEKCILSDESFTHLDFLFSENIIKNITPMIFSYLETGEYECL